MDIDKTLETIQVYEQIAQKYSVIFDNDHSDNPYLDKFLEYLTTGKRIADIGSGTGRISNYYVQKGYKVEVYGTRRKYLRWAFIRIFSFPSQQNRS